MTIMNRTVRDAAEHWPKRCAREGLDTQTIKTHRCQAETHILPALGYLSPAATSGSTARTWPKPPPEAVRPEGRTHIPRARLFRRVGLWAPAPRLVCGVSSMLA